MRFLPGRRPPDSAAILQHFSPLIFLVAGFVGLWQTNYEFVDWRGYEMVTLATNLVRHHAYADPFYVIATGPTAANPPAYPLFLALLMKVFKTSTLVHGAALLGSILANAITAALLPYVSSVFFGEMLSGAIASVLWLGAMQPIPVWDTSYSVVGVIAFVLLTWAHISKRTHFVWFAILDGAIAGVLFLLNPSSILVFGPWLAYLYARRRLDTPLSLRYCVILIL